MLVNKQGNLKQKRKNNSTEYQCAVGTPKYFMIDPTMTKTEK